MYFEDVIFTGHAIRQMFARGISIEEVHAVLARYETVTAYPEDTPYPSRLILGFARGRALHVLIGYNEVAKTGYVITAYDPDPDVWEKDLKTRKRP